MSDGVGWATLRERFGPNLGGLPLLICGPMLRRVTTQQVSVFIVTSRPCRASLSVYATPDIVLDDGTTELPLMIGARETVALGRHVHVAVVTAEDGDMRIRRDSLWYYDLELVEDNGDAVKLSDVANWETEGVASTGLFDLGGAALTNLFTYGDTLPSFRLPISMVKQTRVLHGSCRKPHGGGRDGLAIADQILAKVHGDPWKRPTQLFLTGDQIYADDVSDVMLHMLRDACEALFGWEERLPADDGGALAGGASFDPGSIHLKPNHRYLLCEAAKLCTAEVWGGFPGPDPLTYHRNHLLTFQEYCAMYLFAWSPVLWPLPGNLPTFEDLPDHAESDFDFPRRYWRAAPALTNFWTPMKTSPQTWHRALEDASAAQRRELQVFQHTLLRVRRALANIPTYMMFDDHEITDDLFLNLRWVQGLEEAGNHLGRRILSNGFAAYAVFQHWGNQPDDFRDGGRGEALLDALDRGTNLSSTADLTAAQRSTIDGVVLPALGSPAESREYSACLVHQPNGLDWHYRLYEHEMPWEVLVLDTRTRRSFPGAGEGDTDFFAGLISAEGIEDMIPATRPSGLPTTLLISPAPYTGNPLVEDTQAKTSTWQQRTKKDCEAWGLELNASERLLARLCQRVEADCEAVVVLSGDVHYGFTQRLQCWWTEPFEGAPEPRERSLVLAQLTSSSLKNHVEAGMWDAVRDLDLIGTTRQAHDLGYEILSSGLPPVRFTFGWNRTQIGAGLRLVEAQAQWSAESSAVGGAGLMLRRTSDNNQQTFALPVAPHWQHRLDYVESWRDIYDLKQLATEWLADVSQLGRRQGFPQTVAHEWPLTEASALQAYAEHVGNLADFVMWGHGRQIVGETNLGEVDFGAWFDEQGALRGSVRHNLWYRLRDKDFVELGDALPLHAALVDLEQVPAWELTGELRYPKPSERLDQQMLEIGEPRR